MSNKLSRYPRLSGDYQGISDGTWQKTPRMGFMFVPLTQYHGGGEAATIEPLNEHLDHYETRLRNLFGHDFTVPNHMIPKQRKELVNKWFLSTRNTVRYWTRYYSSAPP